MFFETFWRNIALKISVQFNYWEDSKSKYLRMWKHEFFQEMEKGESRIKNLLTFYGKRSKIILFSFAGNVELKMGFFKRPHVRVFFGGIRSRCLALVKYWPICSAPIIRLWQLNSRHKNRKIEEFCAEKKDRSSYVPTWANSSSVNRIGHPGQR